MNQEWLARQFRGASVAEVVRDCGWIHTAGGTGVNLSLFARGFSSIEDDDVFEVPAVRESMMLVHRDDVSLALAAGRRTFANRLRKLDLDMREIDRAAETIGSMKGEFSIDEIRREVPSRSLGEAGRKLGLTSTAVVAARIAQLNGFIVRAAENRYRRAPFKMKPIDDIDVELAKRFIEWAAPTNAEEFAAWSGLGKRAAAKALAGLTPSNRATQQPRNPIHFLPFRDNYTWFHRLEPTHHHTIVIDGEVQGWFEYGGNQLVWRLRSGKRPKDVAKAAEKVETFIREQLGDLRHYAADNEKNRAARVAFVRGKA